MLRGWRRSAPRPHKPPLLVLREGLEHSEQRAGHAVEVGKALVGRANVDTPLKRAAITVQAPGEPVQLSAPLLGPLNLQRVGPGQKQCGSALVPAAALAPRSITGSSPYAATREGAHVKVHARKGKENEDKQYEQDDGSEGNDPSLQCHHDYLQPRKDVILIHWLQGPSVKSEERIIYSKSESES